MKIIQFPHYCGGRLLFGLSRPRGDLRDYAMVPVLRTTQVDLKKQFDRKNFVDTRYSRLANMSYFNTLSPENLLMVSILTVHRMMAVQYRELIEQDAERDRYGYLIPKYHYEKIHPSHQPYFATEHSSPTSDPMSLIPDNKEDFFYLLGNLLRFQGAYAFVYAVTNGPQAEQGTWLKEAGFTIAAHGAKPGGSPCTNWIGDRKVLEPFLSKYLHRHDFLREGFKY